MGEAAGLGWSIEPDQVVEQLLKLLLHLALLQLGVSSRKCCCCCCCSCCCQPR